MMVIEKTISLPSINVEHGGNSKGSSPQSSQESSEVLPMELLVSSSSKPKSKNGSSVVEVDAWLALDKYLLFKHDFHKETTGCSI